MEVKMSDAKNIYVELDVNISLPVCTTVQLFYTRISIFATQKQWLNYKNSPSQLTIEKGEEKGWVGGRG